MSGPPFDGEGAGDGVGMTRSLPGAVPATGAAGTGVPAVAAGTDGLAASEPGAAAVSVSGFGSIFAAEDASPEAVAAVPGTVVFTLLPGEESAGTGFELEMAVVLDGACAAACCPGGITRSR